MLLWILTSLTAFVTLTCLVLAAAERGAARRRVAVARVGKVLGAGAPAELVDSILKDERSDLSSMLSSAARRFRALRALELMLYRAGQPMTLGRLLGLCAGFAGVGLAIGLCVAGGAFPIALGALPFLYVRR